MSLTETNTGISNRFIYFIRAGEFIKIGISGPQNFGKRLESLRTFCPFEATLLGTVAGNLSYERQLHRRFGFCHYRGEWFNACPKLLHFILTVTGYRNREREDLRKFHRAISGAEPSIFLLEAQLNGMSANQRRI